MSTSAPVNFIERCVEANHGLSVIGMDVAFTTITVLAVSLRVYVRLLITKSFSWDDACIVIAAMGAVATFSVFMKEAVLGVGHHVDCLRPDRLILLAELEYVDQVLTVFTLMFARLSACILLLRIFTRSAGRIVVYVLSAVILAMSIASICIIIPQCKPTAKLWDPQLPGHCWSPHVQLSVGYFNGAVSVFSDLALSLLPIYFLRTVHMKRSLKIAVCAVMGIGVFTAICAVMRTILLSDIKSKDITWVIIPDTIWGGLETRLGVIAAAVPPIRPLFAKEQGYSANKAPYHESRRALNPFSTTLGGTSQSFGKSLAKGFSDPKRTISGSNDRFDRQPSGDNERIAMERMNNDNIHRSVEEPETV